MNKAKLMDLNTIESLRSVLEDGIYELFDAFIIDCPATIERLASAIKNNNLQEINDAAHYLKGSGGNIGAIAFANACKVLELQAKNNALIEAEIQMVQIRQLFEETASYMKNKTS